MHIIANAIILNAKNVWQRGRICAHKLQNLDRSFLLKNNMTTISYNEYKDAQDDNAGFCTHCQEITNHGDCEPDACNYECEECGNNTVFGIEEALLQGLITVEE
jgi:hypothetical protein